MNRVDFAQIVYVSIVGAVMLAAFLEWFLWLAAFLYCLVKVFQKAEHWSIRILALIMMLIFTLLRLVTFGDDGKAFANVWTVEPSSSRSWSSRYLFHHEWSNIFPWPWSSTFNGLLSGRLLGF